MAGYLRPERLHDALQALGAGRHVVLAGGTDLYPATSMREAWGEPGLAHPEALPVLDISAVSELAQIRRVGARLEIGALATWSDILGAALPPGFEVLKLAAREVGSVQIQNRATVAGNLCNASPAADGVPALLVLDASVRLESAGAQREVPLADFVLGSRRNALAPGELVTAVSVPLPEAEARSTFLKLGARRYLVISIAMVAVWAEVVGGHIQRARVAVGACSEVAQRLPHLEARLAGVSCDEVPDLVEAADFDMLTPIDDVRAEAWYRREAAQVLTRRALGAVSR